MAPLRSLKVRIALTVFVLECAMMAAALWATSGSQTAALRAQQATAQGALLDFVAGVSRTALLTDELSELRVYFETLQRDPAVDRVLLGNRVGVVVGSDRVFDLGKPLPPLEDGPAALWRVVPIDNASGRLGVLAMRFSTAELLRAQADARRLGLAIAAAGMSLIAVVGFAIGVLLTRRLALLNGAARRMAEGDRTVRAQIPGDDELADLGRAFDGMADAVARQEQQLRDERETTALVLASTAEAIYGVDAQGRCSFANPACVALLGAADAAVLTGQLLADSVHGPAAAAGLRAVWEQGDAWHGEDQVRSADGSRFAAEVWAHPMQRDGRCVGAVITFVDIAERKRAETALRAEQDFTAAVLGNAGALLVVLDAAGRICRFNRAAEQLSGWSFAELQGRRPWDLLLPPDIAPAVRAAAFDAVVRDPDPAGTTYRNEWLTRAGVRCWIDWTNTLLRDEAGQVQFMVSIGVDVTERRAAEERIRVALHEKELLLKEIYHRVKNNLQMVVSLLALQSRDAGGAEVREALRESASRIKSMALVHEQLYQSGDLSVIDAGRYLQQLAHHIAEAQGEVAQRVPLQLALQKLALGIESAVPLGLLVNELVVNAYKHGFPAGRRGHIRVSLACADDGCAVLGVDDDGVGLPPGFDVARAPSLGLRLVHGLAAQLDGELHFADAPAGGCSFQLRFRPELPEARRLPAAADPRPDLSPGPDA